MSFYLDERLKAEQDRMLSARNDATRAKAGLSFEPNDYPGPARLRRLGVFGAGMASAAAALFLILVGASGPEPLSASLDGKSVAVGEWVFSNGASARNLSFSDGSSIVLSESAGLRIQGADDRGALISLEHGTIDARITHRKLTRWKIQVGPYVVAVTGTRFIVGWTPGTQSFRLFLKEGSVAVTGPTIASKRVLKAGDQMIISPDENNKATVVSDSVPSGDANRMFEPETEPLDRPEARTPARKRAGPMSAWKIVAEAGRYAEAAAAARGGLPQILSKASAADLLLLGDTARRAGDTALAMRAYKAVRNRFPATANASSAAFSLGTMAFDQRRAYAEAARWFEACLNTRTPSPFSREAAGRLMESRGRAGDREGAAAAAERYLQQYPNGPHALLARKLITVH